MLNLTSYISHLVEEGWQIGAQLDHQVPPDLHFSEHQSLCPDMYGCEGLHQEFHPFAAAQNVFIGRKRKKKPIWTKSSQQGVTKIPPGLRAKLSMRLFQAMKAIFLMVGEELRNPSSSRCSSELMKGPPLCSSCVVNRQHSCHYSPLHKKK